MLTVAPKLTHELFVLLIVWTNLLLLGLFRILLYLIDLYPGRLIRWRIYEKVIVIGCLVPLVEIVSFYICWWESGSLRIQFANEEARRCGTLVELFRPYLDTLLLWVGVVNGIVDKAGTEQLVRASEWQLLLVEEWRQIVGFDLDRCRLLVENLFLITF